MLMCLTLLFHVKHLNVSRVFEAGDGSRIAETRYAFQGAEVSTKFGLMEVGI